MTLKCEHQNHYLICLSKMTESLHPQSILAFSPLVSESSILVKVSLILSYLGLKFILIVVKSQ